MFGMNEFYMLHHTKIKQVGFGLVSLVLLPPISKAQLLYFLAHDKKISIHRGNDDRFLQQLQNEIEEDLAKE
jgi:hypothetical protein